MTKDEKIKELLSSVQTIHALANLIILEYHRVLVDHKLGYPVLNQKAKRIAEYSNDIKNQFNNLVNVKDKEFSDNEHVVALWRVMSWFATVDTNVVNNYMDQLEAMPTIDIMDTIDKL